MKKSNEKPTSISTPTPTNTDIEVKRRASLTLRRNSISSAPSVPLPNRQAMDAPVITNEPLRSSSFTSPQNVASSSNLDIDALLQDADNDAISANDNNSYGASTAVSSLLPFQGGGMIRSQSDFSSIGSSLGNILDANISIDDDLECGPVPDYPRDEIRASDKKKNTLEISSSNDGKRPNEVYINTAKIADQTSSSNTPSRLSAFMGISRRHKSSDASIGGSSTGSNSLSSIFESIGYLKRNRQPHHSRGLKKKKEAGALYRFLTGTTEKPSTFSSEREEYLYRHREARMVNLRASILLLFLVFMLICIIELSTVNDESTMMVRKRVSDLTNSDSTNDMASSDIEQSRSHFVPAVVSSNLIKVPKEDERPTHLKSERSYGDKKQQVNIVDISKQEKEEYKIDSLLNGASPEQFKYVSNTRSPDPNNIDIPLLWDIPQSGNDSLKEIITTCLSLRTASDFAIQQYANKDFKLDLVQIGKQNMVNVDLTTPVGIDQAQRFNLVSSKMTDIIITPLFLDSIKLFDEKHHGRAFAFVHHPVKRAISMYEYLKSNNHAEVKDMTLDAYARSPFVENNWMVRSLTGKQQGDVSFHDLVLAQEILERKIFVGLTEYENISLKRFEEYFGFTYDNKTQLKCRNDVLKSKSKKKQSSPKVEEGGEIWASLEYQNELDLKLYENVKQLYNAQGEYLSFNKKDDNLNNHVV